VKAVLNQCNVLRQELRETHEKVYRLTNDSSERDSDYLLEKEKNIILARENALQSNKIAELEENLLKRVQEVI
jgi:hypothetical protein